MRFLKTGDYWLWEWYYEYFTMTKQDRQIVRELRKMKRGK
jgi:hypothetical protein